eukprot:CAMPEP_0116864700 /NCGR_PEP_ID=MMETSP0418-20121206/24974_1 /TAXON_ID=1158023 /ORGANISM="Astrosyne radiata, Strain 13vi08-1A" /LENGTH=163 /DNA_ID=CAMNT_0004499963 /DNA_START=20 /DNA_END=512 /DNA_ORIENTATION=+
MNIVLRNGVVHTIDGILEPDWLRKSIYDVLVKTNETRGGDLSLFLSMLEASRNQVAFLDALKQKDNPVTTEGVPFQSLFQVLLDNHLVLTNFVRDVELVELASTNQELTLTSTAEFPLHVVIGPVITINDEATIVQEDILSEFGVLQIIDHLLVPPGMDVSAL